MGQGFLLLFSLLGLFKYGFSIRCFECQDMPTPHSCHTVVDCVEGDLCTLEQVVTSSGYILYNQGCQSRLRCNTIDRRSSDMDRALTDVPTCDECCSSDYCNNAGCGETAPSRNTRGPYCYQCDEQADEDRCRTVTTCAIDETCVVMNTTNSFASNGEMSFQAGCIYISQCHALQSMYHPHVTSGTGGVIDQCPMCCRDDFCNDNCNHNVTTTTTAPAVDGQWSLWTQWSTCSVSCGSGEHTRTRLCNNPAPQNNGQTCTGDNLDMATCTLGTCSSTPSQVDGQWSKWTQWGSCSVTCGQGTATRGRICADPAPQNGGNPCAGEYIETQACDTHNPCAASGCPQYFHYYPGVGCYHLVVHQPTEYPTAEHKCSAHGAHVLAITNSTTASHVKNLLADNNLSYTSVWLGLHWDSGKHAWLWNNGQILHSSDYMMFNHGFPDGTPSKSCVNINNNVWHVIRCDLSILYICVL